MSNVMYRHYLITRFNLRKDDWITTKNNDQVLTEKWLENRFMLFEKICLPSVQHQTNQYFTWLVFFDLATPDAYQRKIAGYSSICPNFRPAYIDGMPQFLPAIQGEIMKAGTPYVITTRLDNDDCISRYFIDEVQHHARCQDHMIIDFTDGYTLQTAPETRIGKRKQAFNPFISLIEKNDHPRSVWDNRGGHSGWKRERNMIRAAGKRVWMSVIHPENKSNKFEGYGKVNMAAVFNDFIMDKAMQAVLTCKQLKVSSWRWESFIHKLSSYRRFFYTDIKRNLGLY